MKAYFDIISINLITLTIGLVTYFAFNQNIELLSVIIATGISISFGILQYKIENDKIFKDLFTSFNQKYDSKFNNKLNDISRENANNPKFELSSEDQAILIDYLNLCAEEYLWHCKGRISSSVWNSWENGMVYFLNIPSINTFIQSESNQKDSYYGLFNKIGSKINNWK